LGDLVHDLVDDKGIPSRVEARSTWSEHNQLLCQPSTALPCQCLQQSSSMYNGHCVGCQAKKLKFLPNVHDHELLILNKNACVKPSEVTPLPTTWPLSLILRA